MSIRQQLAAIRQRHESAPDACRRSRHNDSSLLCRRSLGPNSFGPDSSSTTRPYQTPSQARQAILDLLTSLRPVAGDAAEKRYNAVLERLVGRTATVYTPLTRDAPPQSAFADCCRLHSQPALDGAQPILVLEVAEWCLYEGQLQELTATAVTLSNVMRCGNGSGGTPQLSAQWSRDDPRMRFFIPLPDLGHLVQERMGDELRLAQWHQKWLGKPA